MEKYSLEYLQNLIENQIEESLHLDYKASGSFGKQNDKTSEISKDVSAMANADGGILIYGIIEDENNKHLPKEIQPIKRKEYPKEWLEQIINDKIQPRINGIEIFSISIENEYVIYIVEIPKSDTAHQAADKKYYKRFNFLSTAMHDYEIRDIFNRAKNPQIHLEFKYLHQTNELIVVAYNTGKVYAKYLNVKLRLPKKIVVSRNDNFRIINNDIVEIFMNNTVRDLLNNYSQIAMYGQPRYEPTLPQTNLELARIRLHNYPFDYENMMEWDIFCDNANSIKSSIRLSDLLK
ncbi:helix-turn-helix domain-containing protein [Flavobacterium sp. 5]|uniref:AlbA family DNA-binding domain-containing protein n=1 Tax=Flavobacterium sp. 5 TaxID=2035199 RepID=UPI000C2C1CE5|nr:ATP-binding protein [Flavobacterium sp. 5]PKB16699.1 putative DNA-binding protein [Flavobacterium sp. 5]